MKLVLCTIIVVLTSNIMQKKNLHLLCSVPCCEVNRYFCFWLYVGRRWASRTLNLKQIGTDSGVFPQFQTAVCFFQQQLPVAAGGFPVTLFQDPLSSFVIALYPFEGLRTVALFEVQGTVCACWEPLGFAPRPVAVSVQRDGHAKRARTPLVL